MATHAGELEQIHDQKILQSKYQYTRTPQVDKHWNKIDEMLMHFTKITKYQLKAVTRENYVLFSSNCLVLHIVTK